MKTNFYKRIKCIQLVLIGLLVLLHQDVVGQDTVYLTNPSFEDIPRFSNGVRGWKDCGFPGESAPDVQPFFGFSRAKWGQSIAAQHGRTYLGMVVRDNDTYERVAQPLQGVVQAGQCYRFEIWICKSNNYISMSHKTQKEENYVQPATLKVWGGNSYCDRRQLFGVTETIDNNNWQKYIIEFKAKMNFTFIMLEAFYKTPALTVYNGNILLDNASNLIPIECPDEPIDHSVPVAAAEINLEEPIMAVADAIQHKREARQTQKTPIQKKPVIKPIENPATKKEVVIEEKPQEKKIMKELDRKTLKKGQAIEIQKLFFEADVYEINEKSYEVLDEIVIFLNNNSDIKIEIGGHTNNLPEDDFCYELSNNRAQEVVKYLIDHGVDKSQLSAKGYGKTKPLFSNNSEWGRARNQRVEIKILKIGNS